MNNNKSYWPHGIIGFFLIVFAFNFWFLYQAIISNKGYIEEDTYTKSINYQEVINLRNKSKNLGVKLNYEIDFNNFVIKLSKLDKISSEINSYKLVFVLLSSKASDIVIEGSITNIVKSAIEIQKELNLAQGQWLFKFFLFNENKEELFIFEDKFLTD